MEWQPPLKFSPADKTSLLKLARATLIAAFSDKPAAPLDEFKSQIEKGNPAQEILPCFVTLLTRGTRLRGCIGTLFADAPLYKNIFEFSQKAAFNDPRFPPLKEKEIPSLTIEITVLGPTTPLPSLDLLEIGKHGLVVESKNKRGVLLAQVATEWKWDKTEFLKQTCIKAGLDPASVQDYKVSFFDETAFRES